MEVPIQKQGEILVATVPPAIRDVELFRFRDDLADRVGRFRSLAVIVDLTALDIVDSFAARTLRGIAHTVALRGAHTIVVGIQPDVAFAMVQLGLTLDGVETALDLDEGLEIVQRSASRRRRRG